MKRRNSEGKNIPDFGIKHASRSGQAPEAGIAFRSKLWVEKDGKLLMGTGRATLLERIDELGSISAAAKSMKLTYRNAWLWVEAMNRLAGNPLVEKSAGGDRGGYARLTEAGRRIVAEYKIKRTQFRELLQDI